MYVPQSKLGTVIVRCDLISLKPLPPSHTHTHCKGASHLPVCALVTCQCRKTNVVLPSSPSNIVEDLSTVMWAVSVGKVDIPTDEQTRVVNMSLLASAKAEMSCVLN